MDRIIKVPSLQGDISTNQNLIDFDVDEGMVYDFSKSYVELEMEVSTTSTNAGANLPNHSGGETPYNHMITVEDKGGSAARHLPTVALVRHAHLQSQVAGQLEHLRNVNVLRCNQKVYTLDDDDKMTNSLVSLNGHPESRLWGSVSPFIDTGDDVVGARKLKRSVRVPLRDVFNLGSETSFDCNRLGRCRIHLEMDWARTAAASAYIGDQILGANGAYGGFDDIGAGNAGNVIVLTTTRTYGEDFLESIPYYVGQKLSCSTGTHVVNAGANVNTATFERNIASIALNRTSNKVELTLDNAIVVLAAADSYTGVIWTPTAPAAATVVCNGAELVLHINNSPAPASVIQYKTYNLEEDNGLTSTLYNKQYEIEPSVSNLYFYFTANDGLLSDNGFNSYRMAINNELITNRDVHNNTQVYFNRLNRCMNNAEMPTKNLTQDTFITSGAATPANGQFKGANNIRVICEPLPLSGNLQLVNLTITSGGLNKIYLYKEVVREV